MSNYVYVIRYGERDHKIGFSVRPSQRLRELRDTSPEPLTLVKTWRRRAGDAETVERRAHLLLKPWNLFIPGQWERFEVSARIACKAVELAAAMVRDEQPVAASTAEQLGIDMPPPVPRSDGIFRIGYVAGSRQDLLRSRSRALVEAGVEPGRIYMDGAAFGPALAAAVKAVRNGDRLCVPSNIVIPDEVRARVAEKGAHIMEVPHGR